MLFLGAKSDCNSGQNKILHVKSWFVNTALILRQKANSKSSFWVGKYDDIKDYPVTTSQMWTTGGQDIEEDCVMADENEAWKWKRVSCSSSATYFCEPKPPDCPPGYHFVAAVGDKSCFKLSDFAMESQNNDQNVSSVLTANKMCLEDKTRMATPMTNAHRDALAKFALNQDQILFGEKTRSLKFYTGHMFFDQQSIVPSSCPTCAALPDWQSGWITPWSDSLTPAASLPDIPSNVTQCVAVKYDLTTGSASWQDQKCVEGLPADGLATMAMCEFKKCDGCVFPFIYGGRTYDTCVTHGTVDGSSWCSTEVDENGFHVEGKSIDCPADCFKNDCPVGFRFHLKTCIQESASSRIDNPETISEAEEECMFQGGRLYQPRSTRSLNAASTIIPRVYDGTKTSNSYWGIHNWAREISGLVEETAIGMVYNFDGDNPRIDYKDGSQVPQGLVDAKLNWLSGSGYPTITDTDTCITLQQLDKISNNECDKYSDKDTLALSYVCEARSFVSTVDGPQENPGKVCIFPFKKESGGEWLHSCLYDPLPENKWDVWCATQVDAEGVVTAKGNCDDERNTAYDGPDADNTCKMPFFWDGRWYENCTLYPKDDYWCATKIDPDTREILNGE